ncbi:peptidyl-prolyl cis-trans isomerase [Anaeromyxobacter sp. Fw109-5]|uniref:peptidylprolyl isomerase n=1 Tax=Anaeromyxobacter sp. (strain Fw109-5) TaxID=404589 RepID=UPI0000ED73A6|nr:peptidyl-prolyl cis-trans isomerase [Anaeromyxobacter sp. Fw109-5]ABS26531.1 PpiC-type peptidyl-prolyl cis-trans isomerase [Anaeromyxobacter sp. Fw109-5]
MRRIALVLAVTAAAACSKGDKNGGPIVAKGDGISVTADAFKKKLDEQSPFIRARYSALERKKEFLENLIRFELLAREAQAKGLDKDPEVQETLKKIMVQKLVRQAFDSEAGKPADDEARKYYDEHLDEFVKPERARVSAVIFAAPAGSPDRAAKAGQAKNALARLKVEGPKNPLAFSNLARELSDDPVTKAAGGDLGYRTKEELSAQHSPELANAAFALREVGQESGVVETPRGFAILKLGARQAPIDRPFDEVKAQIAARIGRESRTKEFDSYVKGLREKASIEIFDAELEKIAITGAPPPGASDAMAVPAAALAPARH